MNAAFGVCAVCCREIPVRNDGRLRAHLAATNRPGNREQCDGSGSASARLDLLPGQAGRDQGKPLMSRDAAFNAREEWLKADALYTEYLDMCEVGGGGAECGRPQVELQAELHGSPSGSPRRGARRGWRDSTSAIRTANRHRPSAQRTSSSRYRPNAYTAGSPSTSSSRTK